MRLTFTGWGRFVRVAFVALAGLSLTGCPSSDDDDESPECSLPSGARGSAECQRWQTSVCDFTGRCPSSGTLTKCDCFDQASSITCISEAEATRCADALNAASCSAPPSGCDLLDLADPAPAQAACQQYLQAVCDAVARCGGDDVPTCLAEVMLEVDCSTAVGTKPQLDTCLSELAGLSCSASELPKSCEEAVLVSG